MTWVIGNGESRKLVNVSNLEGTKIGCNAIHRDFKVDHLICVDRRMVKEAVNASYHKNALVYTRKEWWVPYRLEPNLRMVPNLPYKGTQRWDEPFQWGSGPYAVLLGAIETTLKEVKLIGFDLYSKTKYVNNIYKNTENYDPQDKTAVDPRYWIHQIGMVFKCFPEIYFIIYQDEDWNIPDTWKFSNVKVDKISNIV